MVAIPTIKYGFLFVAWYRPGLVERTLGVVCLLWRADSVPGNQRYVGAAHSSWHMTIR